MMRGYLIGKNYWSLKILLVALAIFAPASNAAWEFNGPAGAFVTDFALAPSNPALVLATAAGANEGIWYSDISGNPTTWTRRISSQPYDGAAMQANAFDFMLAGVRNGEIEVSTDRFVNRGPTAGGDSNLSWIIEYAPSEPDTVYAAGHTPSVPDGILQKSTDSGNNWVTSDIGGDANPPTFSLAIAPTDVNTVYVGAQPAGASNGLYKSTNGAISWSYLSALNFPRVDAVAVDPVDLDYVYAGTTNSGLIQRSVDGGANWVVLHDPSNGGVAGFAGVSGLAINPADRRIIYAVGGIGSTRIIVSTDCGVSWANVDETGLDTSEPDKVVIDPINDYVMVRMNSGFMYREALRTDATDDCDASTRSSGSGSSFDFLLLGMLMLIGIVRYRKSLISA